MKNVSFPRQIRSFIRREGRMTERQKQGLIQGWPVYGLEPFVAPLQLQEVLPKANHFVLEIGFGMGRSLLEMAYQHPDWGFIGIEVHRPGVGALLADLADRPLQNVRVYCHDAVEILQRCIPDHSFHLIQIFFPDPWPKKRHHKRRLIQKEFIELLVTKLKHGGEIHLATDWEHYAQQMLQVLSENLNLENKAGENKFYIGLNRPTTKFEQRGLKLGHAIWELRFQMTKLD